MATVLIVCRDILCPTGIALLCVGWFAMLLVTFVAMTAGDSTVGLPLFIAWVVLSFAGVAIVRVCNHAQARVTSPADDDDLGEARSAAEPE